jgi:hypothetical protein
MAWPWLPSGSRDPTPSFPDILADPERLCCLVEGGFDFASHGERHVHRNHVVRAVRLVRVHE